MSMPVKCLACRHPREKYITKDLLSGLSIRKTAEKYGLGKTTIQNHKTKCMARDWQALIDANKRELKIREQTEELAMTEAGKQNVTNILNGIKLVETIDEVLKDAEHIYGEALGADNLGVANQALKTKLSTIDAYAKVAAEAREREKMQIDKMKDEWGELRDVMRKILAKYPGALEELERELSNRRSDTFE